MNTTQNLKVEKTSYGYRAQGSEDFYTITEHLDGYGIFAYWEYDPVPLKLGKAFDLRQAIWLCHRHEARGR